MKKFYALLFAFFILVCVCRDYGELAAFANSPKETHEPSLKRELSPAFTMTSQLLQPSGSHEDEYISQPHKQPEPAQNAVHEGSNKSIVTQPDESPAVQADENVTANGDNANDAINYIIVPRFYNLSVGKATEYLASYGINAKPDDEQAGADAPVVVVSFFGKWDDENFYFIPGKDVTLKVGGVPEEEQPKPYNKPHKAGNVAYLTFDDGPTKYNTQKILDILGSYGVKATFFVVGTAVERFPGRAKEINESGSIIGCHSYSHDYASIYSSKEGFLSDLERWYDVVSGELGEDYACTLYRMPGGSACARRYAGYGDIMAELEFREMLVFDWTMSNNDVWSRSKAGSLSPIDYMKKCFIEQLELIDGTGKPVIILMHETYDATVEMLPWAIELLLSKGYTFDTLDNLPASYLQR